MKVLSVASEVAPLVKTGGLADVAGALPAALRGQGIDMRVLVPGYPAVAARMADAVCVATFDDLFGDPARVLFDTVAGVPVLMLEQDALFDRAHGIYLGPDGADWPDNPIRFAALSLAAAWIARDGVDGWVPDLLHGHDWQAGLAPYYLSRLRIGTPSIMTIHNMAFSGLAPADMLGALKLDRHDFHADGFEFWGRISALKAGLVTCDRITTVSPTYAEELKTDAFGMGFGGLMRARAGDLQGILNGIDLDAWDPATDPDISNFDTPAGKDAARRTLRRDFDLPPSDGPVAVVVSRLTEQKGLDLLLDALPGFLDRGGQLALLGSGTPALEGAYRQAALSHPGVGVRIGYDEGLSHRMMAGADVVLVPSRFEPCGLTQLYGLRYGAIPVVARTGGLADTVIDANDAALRAGVATGLIHDAGNAHAVWLALSRLLDLWQDRDRWEAMMWNAMRHPVGWDVSAGEYAALYRSLTA